MDRTIPGVCVKVSRVIVPGNGFLVFQRIKPHQRVKFDIETLRKWEFGLSVQFHKINIQDCQQQVIRMLWLLGRDYFPEPIPDQTLVYVVKIPAVFMQVNLFNDPHVQILGLNGHSWLIGMLRPCNVFFYFLISSDHSYGPIFPTHKHFCENFDIRVRNRVLNPDQIPEQQLLVFP